MGTEGILTVLGIIAAVLALLSVNHMWVREGVVVDIEETLSPDGNHDITLISILRNKQMFNVYVLGHETKLSEGNTVKFGQSAQFESYYVDITSKEGTIETELEVEYDIALAEALPEHMIEVFYKLWKLELVEPAKQ